MTTNGTKTRKATEQIAEMQALKQDAAAWLVGFEQARSLRESVTAPRNADGTYDGRKLVEWRRGKPIPAELSDSEAEQLQQAAERVAYGLLPRDLVPVVKLLDWLEQQHGDAGLLSAMHAIYVLWKEQAAEVAEFETPQAEAARNRIRERQQELERSTRELRLAVVCQGCRKLRQGDNWKATKPADGLHIVSGACPECVSIV